MRQALLFRFLAISLLTSAAFCAAPPAKEGAFDQRLGPPFEIRDRPTLGSDQAPIVVVEFGSYKCSHCEEFHQRVFPQLNEEFIKSGKVQWFLVPTSDDSAQQSSRIFAIGRCVERQGKFWESLDYLMSISNRPPSFVTDLAKKNPATNADELGFCLQDREIPRLVARDFDEYKLLKIPGTPTFIVRKLKADGTRTEAIVRGYQPVEYFQRLFGELAKAQ